MTCVECTWTKLRDCFHINEITAEKLKNVFLVYGERDIKRIEISVPPEKWIKIYLGNESKEVTCESSQ
jgi:hypothetical protein